jgi:5-oxoprolinase (ATP-hydrolysing)
LVFFLVSFGLTFFFFFFFFFFSLSQMEFTSPVRFSVLSERRVLRPRGLAGGGDGALGENLLIKGSSGLQYNLGGKNSVRLQPGDRVRILTPGAGGYGAADADDAKNDMDTATH